MRLFTSALPCLCIALRRWRQPYPPHLSPRNTHTSLARSGRGDSVRGSLALLFLFGLDVQHPVDRLLRLRQSLLGKARELRGVEPAHLPRRHGKKPGPSTPFPSSALQTPLAETATRIPRRLDSHQRTNEPGYSSQPHRSGPLKPACARLPVPRSKTSRRPRLPYAIT